MFKNSLLGDTVQSLRRPDHWLFSAWLGVISHHRKNALGLFWILVPPMVYIWGIGWFIGMINPVVVRPFMAHVGIGFVMFRLITSVLNDAAGTFNAHQPYINDGNTRLTDYLFAGLARGSVLFLFAAPLVGVAMLLSTEFDATGIVESVVGLAVVLVNLYLWSVPISLLGARFPDFNEFMSNATMALFLITPIVWYPTAAPMDTLHGQLMRANPLHHLIAVVRAPLTPELIEPSTYYYLATMTLTGVVLAVVTYRVFSRRVPVWI